MLKPLYIARPMRAELMPARSTATALARNLGHLLGADRIVPFALARIDDLLADDVVRLLGCLAGAQALHDPLGKKQVADLALDRNGAGKIVDSPVPAIRAFPALNARAAA